VADPPIAVAKPPGNARLVILSLLAVYVIWSSTYLALRFVVEAMPPLMAGGGRFIVAGAMLYAFLLWRGAPHPTAREWMLSVPVGALMFLGGNGFVSLAEPHVSSGSAAVMVATMPLFAAGFGVALGERPARREWLGLAVLTLACLLYVMDLTVLHLAVPAISADLQPTSVELLWIIDIYGFMVAGFLITMGTLGDRIGRRKVLLIGAAAFGAASLLCAFSTSPTMLSGTQLFNITGHPAIALPAGKGPEGLPRSIQVVGHRGRTERLLEIAAALEDIIH
jgi:drug/metabolite transporter (DMT)-like permease